jgi:hypothetical protein
MATITTPLVDQSSTLCATQIRGHCTPAGATGHGPSLYRLGTKVMAVIFSHEVTAMLAYCIFSFGMFFFKFCLLGRFRSWIFFTLIFSASHGVEYALGAS